MKIEAKQLKKHFDNYGSHLKDVFPDENEIRELIYQAERLNFFQILYLYDITYLLILLEFFENIQEYSTCAEIVKQIEEQNKLTDEHYKTHL